MASVYHKNDEMFKSPKFSLVPKAGCQHLRNSEDLENFHRVYEREDRKYEKHLARYKDTQVASDVSEGTELQSEDPG